MYSHLTYDIVPGAIVTIDQPDIVILEGLNVLQVVADRAADARVFVSDFFDFSIYVDAPETDIRRWYVERFLLLRATAFKEPESYFHRYAALSDEAAERTAEAIWDTINGPNLRENILPTRERAHLASPDVGLETHVLDWLVKMLDLPQKFLSTSTGGGVIQDTASSASLCALLAARERATNFVSNQRGCDGKLVAYTSAQAHSSIEKDVQIAGLGRENLRMIAVDKNFAMRSDVLARQIDQDREAGLVPCFVCATVGTTSSNAIDPVPEIGRICREQKLWLHVDAAMSGTAGLCPEFRHIHQGLEYADSYCFNPHKWMFTNFDCNCFYVADRKALIQTLSVLPEYLRNQATESGAVIDYRDWQIPLGRRFRSLKLWFVIRHYGVEGLQHHIRQHVELAQQFGSLSPVSRHANG